MDLNHDDYVEKQDDYIEKLFYKSYKFQFNCENLSLPNSALIFSSEPWEDSTFITLKEEMNTQKSLLNDFKFDEWHKHTYSTNHARYISGAIRRNANPELLTNAWTKFYECLSRYDIISESVKKKGILNSVHLCEAPGAFITSLNHYLKLHYPKIKLNWMASSLNPYYEGNSLSIMINDDRFMRRTLNNWNFGSDFTGNLMDWNNSQYIIESSKTLGNISLVTADGSIDCSLKPDEQEATVSSLLYCEVITALQILERGIKAPRDGGSFVVKTFTIYEHSSINLIYLLCTCFKDVNAFKPVTSRPGNSEIYLICVDYKGIEIIAPHMEIFREYFDSAKYLKKSIFPYDELPEEFVKDVRDASVFFHRYQYDVIGNNVLLYATKDAASFEQLKYTQNKVKDFFFDTYYIKAINNGQKICKKSRPEIRQDVNLKRSKNESYNELTNAECRDMDSRLKATFKKFKSINNTFIENLPVSVDCNLIKSQFLNKYTRGKPIKKIFSSIFIHPDVLQIYNDVNDQHRENLSRSAPHKLEKISGGYSITFSDYNSSDDYDGWEKSSLSFLSSAVSKMELGENLHLRNFKLLTQYNAGTLYAMSGQFSNLTLNVSDLVELNRLNDKVALLKYFDDVDKKIKDAFLQKNAMTILGVVPIELQVDEFFYRPVFNFNNNNMLVYIGDKLNK